MGLAKCNAATLVPPELQKKISKRKRKLRQRDCQKFSVLTSGGGIDAEENEKLPVHPISESLTKACVRGQREFYGWWQKHTSEEILGDAAEGMYEMAKKVMESIRGDSTTLRVLSLADGSMRSCCMVPTSVLLAHAFASLGIYALHPGVHRVVIFGADAGNYKDKPQGKLPSLPKWIELKSVVLDNQKDLALQLSNQCEMPTPKFNAVVMRQGLCFCEDLSWDALPPNQVHLVGMPAGVIGCNCGGLFVLEDYYNGRPAYRRGELLLQWRLIEDDFWAWALVGNYGYGDILAYVACDVGNPALAREAWLVWDRIKHAYVVKFKVACELRSIPPWKREPKSCQCCAGISLHSNDIRSFMKNVAAVLDEAAPRAFALLHSGWYNGTRPEVQEFHSELEEAVQHFNSEVSDAAEPSTYGHILATILKKPNEKYFFYWQFHDGLLLARNPDMLGLREQSNA